MNVCVFCASSNTVDKSFLDLASEFGSALARRGHGLLYGGYTNGMMGRLAEAAHGSGAVITAVVPAIFDCDGFTYRFCDEVIKTADMHERKAEMQRLADAFVVLPGGLGTLDELFDTLDLVMLGELAKPFFVLNAFGFYDWLEALLPRLEETGFLRKGARLAEFCPCVEDVMEGLGKL